MKIFKFWLKLVGKPIISRYIRNYEYKIFSQVDTPSDINSLDTHFPE